MAARRSRGLWGAWLIGIWCLAIGNAMAEGILWRVEKPGVPANYLFGTVHSTDPRLTNLPAPVARAFEGAQTVVLETELDAAAMGAMAKSMVYTDGRSLLSVVGWDLYKKTIDVLAQRGIPEMTVASFKPWAVSLMLSMPPQQRGDFLDLMLYKNARKAGKQTVGLETVEEQTSVFEDMDTADQVALLRQSLKEQEAFPDLFEELVLAYLARDLDAIAALDQRTLQIADPKIEAWFRKVLLEDRNAKMAKRVLPVLDKGNAFVAVGTLHLIGETGLVEGLRKEGYKVTAAY